MAKSKSLHSLTVEEKWQWDDDPDAMDHKWHNYCSSCKQEDYEPFCPQLLHYCTNCGQYCKECGFPKPNFAFPYNYDSPDFKEWRSQFKAGKPVGRAPREAHIDTCNHCHGRELDKAEALLKEEQIKRARALIDNPQTKALVDIMLGKS